MIHQPYPHPHPPTPRRTELQIFKIPKAIPFKSNAVFQQKDLNQSTKL